MKQPYKQIPKNSTSYYVKKTPQQERDEYKYILLAKIDTERELLKMQARQTQKKLSPQALRESLFSTGTGIVSQSAFSKKAFAFMQRHPYLSLRLSRGLLGAVKKGKGGYFRPAVLALAAWYVYNKFNK